MSGSFPPASPLRPPAPQTAPPRLGELFELSLTALVNAPVVFTQLAARPAPGAGGPLLLALVWGGAFFALNLVHVALSNPASLRMFTPATVAAVGALGLGAWAALYLLGAGFLHGLGRALGAEGDFDRALLVASVTLVAAPVSGLCNWFATAWVAPTILAGWIAACGLNALFKANAWAARASCAAVAAGVLAVQYGVREFIDKSASAARTAVPIVTSAGAAESQIVRDGENMQRQNASPDRSGLDLLRVPAGAAAPSGADQRQQIRLARAAGDAMNNSVLGVLDTLAPMLDNPAITQNMTPRQKADFIELRELIADLKASLASGAVITQAEQQRRMTRIQQLAMRMMSAGLRPPQPPAKTKR